MATPEETTHFEEDDHLLIRRCLRGSDSAFEALYNRYRLPFYSYLHRLLAGRPDQVDDFFQQAWVKAAHSLEHYRHQEKFLAWLCRIGHNLVMDYYRSHESDIFDEVPEILSSSMPSPDMELSWQEAEGALKEAIASLPPDQQEVIRLRNDGMSFKEIAEYQHVGLNTALGRMHYAILNLKKSLSEYL